MRSILLYYFKFLGSIFANAITTNYSQNDVIDFIETNVGSAVRIVEGVLLRHMIRVSRLPKKPKNGTHILYLIKKAEEIHEINYLDGLLGNHPNQRIIVAPLQSHGGRSSIEVRNISKSGIGLEITSMMANLLNLSIDVYKERDDNWGFIPEGYNNTSWSGLMSCVYKGEFDMGAPTFLMLHHRSKYFDFLYCFSSLRGGFYFNVKLDPDLLYNPFLIDSWLLIIFITMISIALVITLSSFMGNYLRTQSYSILLLSISLCFVILQAYYGGALTMFLSSKSKPAFQTIKEVIQDPKWTLLLRKGTENAFLRDIVSKIPEPAIIQYRNDVYAQPEKETVKVSNLNKQTFSGFSVVDPRTLHFNFLLQKKSPLNLHLCSCSHLCTRNGISPLTKNERLTKLTL
ncbi:unnamed protein product [Lepeophtheirus salmonis]|uniref:(salmon louse) hypothetical protein n=1 Tax=Lepeophtheirus salmonis TaxID=72036 RepID=A0A7R8H840_LEPSM|nr:unnamed protein product [Lepeophtheirus salmonis]CAF2932411.1 unnamed protein product [Lepeophtheirus salmonis]